MLRRLCREAAAVAREYLEDVVEGVKQDAYDVWDNICELFRGEEP